MLFLLTYANLKSDTIQDTILRRILQECSTPDGTVRPQTATIIMVIMWMYPLCDAAPNPFALSCLFPCRPSHRLMCAQRYMIAEPAFLWWFSLLLLPVCRCSGWLPNSSVVPANSYLFFFLFYSPPTFAQSPCHNFTRNTGFGGVYCVSAVELGYWMNGGQGF